MPRQLGAEACCRSSLDSSPLSQIVLAILIVFSIASWAIILFKTISYRAVARQTATFLDVFRRSQKFSDVQAICPSLPASPLVGVFQAGYAEITAQFRLDRSAAGSPASGSHLVQCSRASRRSIARSFEPRRPR